MKISTYLTTVVIPFFLGILVFSAESSAGNLNKTSPAGVPVPSVVDAPTALAATAVTQTAFYANWASVTGAQGYVLDVSQSAEFFEMLPGFRNLNVYLWTTMHVTDLFPNVGYYYRLRAYNQNDTSEYSNIIYVKTLPNPPSPPVALPATDITQTTFKANWTDVVGAAKFYLDVAYDSTFDVMSILPGYYNITACSFLFYDVTGLAPNTRYYYRVRGWNYGGSSSSSNFIRVVTLPAPPGIPVAESATNITDTSFVAHWLPGSDNHGFLLDVSTDQNFTTFLPGYQSLNTGAATSWHVTPVNASSTYYYRVRAYNPAGTSNYSGNISVNTAIGRPVAPQALPAYNVQATSFSAYWSSVPAAAGYILDIAGDSLFVNYLPGFMHLDVSQMLLYPVNGLSQLTNYYYRLKAYNVSGYSGYSNTVKVTTACLPPVILQDPANTSACTETPSYMRVVATGIGLHFLWYKDDFLLGAPDNDTLYLVAGSYIDAGFYKCLVSNQGGTVLSAAGFLAVYDKPDVNFSTTGLICAGGAPFTLTGGSPAGGIYTGQGVNEGNFDPSLTGPGNFTVVYTFTDFHGCSDTASQVIVVEPQPEIFVQSSDFYALEGGNASFSIVAGQSSGFQWQMQQEEGQEWTDIVDDWTYSGANSNVLIISNSQTKMSGNSFRCRVTQSDCDAFSSPSVLYVSPQYNPVEIFMDSVDSLEEGQARVPVLTRNFWGIGSFSWALSYNPVVISYDTLQELNTALQDGTLDITDQYGTIYLVWNSVTPANIGDGHLFDLIFNYNGGSSPLEWDTLNSPGCTVMNPLPETLPSLFSNSYVAIPNSCFLDGNLFYDNDIQSPLTGATILVSDGISYFSMDTTDFTGYFDFPMIPDGAYMISSFGDLPWGGVNSLDALKIMRHFTGLDSLTGLALLASDVDGTGNVNSNDALLVSMRFVNMVSSFPAGDWLLESDTTTLTGSQTFTCAILGICMGDADRSFNPSSSMKRTLLPVHSEETVFASKDNTAEVPVKVLNPAETGAISLVLEYKEDLIQILDVKSPAAGGNLVFTARGGELRISWFSLQTLRLKAGEVVFTITVRVKDGLDRPEGTEVFFAGAGSVFGDENGQSLPDPVLAIPRLATAKSGFYASACYPNPSTGISTLSYTLPEDAKLEVTLYNHLGERVKDLLVESEAAGTHTLNVNVSGLEAGVYFCHFRVHGKSGEFSETRSLMVSAH